MQHVTAHGATIPAIGLGTWRLSGEGCREAVAFALGAGYRHVDTASAYGNEVEVGQGIRASGVARDSIFVTTKVAPDDFSDARFIPAVEASLRRLDVGAVDLLLLHWPSRQHPVDAVIRRLNQARERGLTRHIGVSNFTTALLDEAWAATDAPLVANQCEYHPYLAQQAVLAACRRHGTAFVSYSPLGKGRLLDEPVILDIAQRLGRSPAQVVLRWHVQQDGVVAVPKSGRPARIAQNIGVFGFELSEADMHTLDALADPAGRIVDPAAAPDWD